MKRDEEKIEKALAAAHRMRQDRIPGDDWEMSVMRSIRNLPDQSEKACLSRLIGKLFWELCPAACAVIILLAVAAYRLNVVPPEDLARMITTDDTIDMILADQNG